mgnify:CR=1 FL=1
MTTSARFAVAMLTSATFTCAAAQAASPTSTLREVEGRVTEIGALRGEGDLELITVRLSKSGAEAMDLDLLLAPESVLVETGFTVEPGDRLKARIFTTEEGPATVHKVKNLTQGSMVRLRTLRQIPLWDNNGRWQGSPGIGLGRGPRQGHQRGAGGSGGPPH